MTGQYDDIINLARHKSKKHPPMAPIDRAAQFAPFAALTGHDAAVKETERLTQERKDLDIYIKEELNKRLNFLMENLKKDPMVKISYFQPDRKKDGGSYLTSRGIVKKIDIADKSIIMEDNLIIEMEEIIDIEGDIFDPLDNS